MRSIWWANCSRSAGVKPEPGQRHDQGVFPMHMAAITFEEASQHIAHHFRVRNLLAASQELEGFGDFAREIGVGAVFRSQPVEDGLDPILGPARVRSNGNNPVSSSW